MNAPATSRRARPVFRSPLFLALVLSAVRAYSQAAAPEAPPAGGILQLDKFVTTGSVTPRSRLESPLAVSILDPQQIQVTAPRSTAEMLKLIPGVYTESSGGEVGNNIVVRGVATNGAVSGYLYVALQEDGLPVWSESNFRFTQADTFVRVTNFVANIEAVRGGSAGVLQSSDPLGIINFISREGGAQVHGEFKLETGDFGLLRNEGWIAGPLGANSSFALGGFYRIDDGIRAPGYTADRGGQLMGNLKYNFPNDKGYLKFLGKMMDDHPAFELPFPLQNRLPRTLGGTVQMDTIPGGPDIRSGAITSPDIRRLSFPNSPVGPIAMDLADGESADFGYAGTEFEYQLADGLKLRALNRYAAGTHLEVRNPFSTPATLQSIVNGLAPKSNSAGAFAAALNPATTNYNFMLTYPGQNGAVAAADPVAAAALQGNGLGDLDSMTYINIKLKNFQEDVRLTQTFNDGKTALTGGLYYSYFQVGTFETVSQQLFDISPSFHRLDVTFLNAATNAPIGKYTYNGLTQLGTTYINSYAEKRATDWFAVLTHQVGSLSLDAGYRHLKAEVSGWGEAPLAYDGNTFVQSTAATNNGLGFIPALKGAVFGAGNTSSGADSRTDYAITAGANYTFADHHTAAFARFSRSPKMIYTNDVLLEIPFGNGSGNGTPTSFGGQNHMTQYELGLKYSRRSVGLFLTAFKVEERNIAFADTVFLPNGSLGTGPVSTLDEDVYGLEVEGIWAPVPGLSVGLHGTYQDPKFVNDVHIKGYDSAGNVIQLAVNGLLPVRIPKAYGNLSIAYELPATAWGTLSFNASCQYTGRRALDQANSEFLAPFKEFAAGVSFATKHGLLFRLQGSNLANSAGITEGDPRSNNNVVANLTAPYANYRPVLPRTIIASVTYGF